MLKKFKDFIIENVDVLDPVKTTITQKPKGGSKRYVMIFVIEDNKIKSVEDTPTTYKYTNSDDKYGSVVLADNEYLNGVNHVAITMLLLHSNMIHGKLYKVEMQPEFVDAVRKQTRLDLKIGEIYELSNDQPLYNWLLRNIDIAE